MSLISVTLLGFVSMHSIRASMQSVTAKRLSTDQQQQQQKQQQSTSMAVANKSINLLNSPSIGTQQKSMSNLSTETFVAENMSNAAISSNSISTSKTSSMASLHASRTLLAKENFLKMSSYETLNVDGHETSFENFSTSSCKNSFEQIMTSNSMLHDNVFSGDAELAVDGNDIDDMPPALPIKTRQRSTRRDRHVTQYDNVEETDNFPK